MKPLSCTALVCLALTVEAIVYSVDNVRAEFGFFPTPFKLDVDPTFVERLRHRAADTRLPHELLDVPKGSDGPPVVNATTVRDYGVDEYDWYDVQHETNHKSACQIFMVPVDIKGLRLMRIVKTQAIHHNSQHQSSQPLARYPASLRPPQVAS
jgi:hypothetical protein